MLLPWELFLLVPAGAGIAHQAAHLLQVLPTLFLCHPVGSLAKPGSWPVITLALSDLSSSWARPWLPSPSPHSTARPLGPEQEQLLDSVF